MAKRSPDTVETLFPLRDGVVADYHATEEMLRCFINRTKSRLGFRRPRILICVPAGATQVERRAVYETAASAGARSVYLVQEPVAASLGVGLPLDDPAASMVVDIGGGTTDIAVLSRAEVIMARSLRCAGNAVDEAIARHVRRVHQLLIGRASAERIKIEAGTAVKSEGGRAAEVHIRGRDLRHGQAKAVVLSPHDIAEAIENPVSEIAEFVQRAIEDLAPAAAAAVCERGIHLTGGGALLDRLDTALEDRIGVRFSVPPNPMHCVVRGTAQILETLAERESLLVSP